MLSILAATTGDVTKAGNAVAAVIGAGLVPAVLEMMDQAATRAVEEFVHRSLAFRLSSRSMHFANQAPSFRTRSRVRAPPKVHGEP